MKICFSTGFNGFSKAPNEWWTSLSQKVSGSLTLPHRPCFYILILTAAVAFPPTSFSTPFKITFYYFTDPCFIGSWSFKVAIIVAAWEWGIPVFFKNLHNLTGVLKTYKNLCLTFPGKKKNYRVSPITMIHNLPVHTCLQEEWKRLSVMQKTNVCR